jgi:glycosyltransferase involved in cell wall biosynthesis
MVNYTSGGLSGGYAKYLKQIVPLLEADARVRRLDVYLPAGAIDPARINSTHIRTWSPRDRRSVFRSVAESAPDVVFIPTARWARFGAIPVTAMVRNMEPLVTPITENSAMESARNVMRRFVARATCKRADRVIAVSNYVREYLETRWGIDTRKIGVVYHGVEDPLPQPAGRRPDALSGFEPRVPFVFTAGSIRPARGLEDLVGASLLDREFHTVIAGAPTTGSARYQEVLRERIAAAGLESRMSWTGKINAAEMAWCYHECDVFVMSTRTEACPNTALEAMSYGTLIVSADTKPLPEFFGDAALYYRAGDAASLADQLQTARKLSLEQRNTLQANARRRAREFRWTDTARRTVDELIECVANVGKRAINA